MKKILIATVFSSMLLGSMLSNAATITTTIPEWSSPIWTGTPTTYAVGTFDFGSLIPMGEAVVSAEISGKWGNSANPTTAHNLLFVDGVQVADTRTVTPDPTFNRNVPWTYTFSDLTPLMDGVADFSVLQLAQVYVRLGATTLTVDTAPVPVPSTLFLLATGLLGAVGISNRKTKK